MAGNKSFARDVTTPIDIPVVQAPDFSASRSTAQDLVGLATFGVALHDRSKAQEAEKLRKQQVTQINTRADALMSKWLNVSGQLGERAANRMLQKDILDFGDPAQSSILSSETAKRIAQIQTGIPAGGTGGSKKDDFLSNVSEKTKARAMIKAGIPLGADLNDVTPDQLASVEVAAREFESLELQDELNTDIAKENTARGRLSINNKASTLGLLLQGDLAPIVDDLTQSFKKLEEVPNPAEQKALVDQIQQSQVEIRAAFARVIDSSFVEIPPSKEKDNAIAGLNKQMDNIFSLFTDPNFDVAKRNASSLDFLVRDLKLDLFNAGNVMIRLKETYGQTIPELTFANLATQGGGSISEKVERAVEDVFFGGNEQQRKAFKLDKYMGYVSGISKIEEAGDLLTREEQEGLYKDAFKFFNDMTTSGKILIQDKDTKEKILGGITFLLEDGNKEKSSQALKIVDFLEHPNTQKIIREADTARKEAIDNMAITYSKTLLTNPVDGVIVELNTVSEKTPIEFDVGAGEFKVVGERPTLRSATGRLGDIRGSLLLANFNSARKAVKKANKALNVFKEHKDSNPTLKGFTNDEAMSWLLRQSSGVQLGGAIIIKGSFVQLPEETDAAIQRRVAIKDEQARIAEIKEKGTIQQQILGQTEELNRLSSLLRDVASGRIDSSALKDLLDAE